MSNDKELSGLPQRKLTSILAADVVGYSRMMGVDEDGTYELLGKCRKIIDRNIEHHGGRIFNTAGDSVMAEFTSTVEAVRCAIEIQEEIVIHNTDKPESEQMWFRIGLNVGDVIVEGDDLIGDGVNIASRMESIAQPSGICISGSVYELVRNKLSFAFDDMGKQSVKNIIEPVSAYSLRPAATPKIMQGIADKQQPGNEKKRSTGLMILAAVLFLLGAAIAAFYFTNRDSGKDNSVIQQEANPRPVPAPGPVLKEKQMPTKRSEAVQKPQTGASTLAGITPSHFVGRRIEGKTSKKGDRLVIEMKERGNAALSTYKKNKRNRVHKTDKGRWWINKEERICFEFNRLNEGKGFCRDYTVKNGREFLVSGDPAKPEWVLNRQ
jgi:class 3 adenylate cyclase